MRLASLAAARAGLPRVQMVGAEILIASAVGQHLVGGGQERGRDDDARVSTCT